jgi:hypothetical protein
MTTLATQPVPDPDQIALFADNWTSLGKPAAERFREVCEADARAHDGWVSPNRVREAFLDGGQSDLNVRQYAALWSTACSPKSGYMVKTEVLEQIAGEGSRGNTNKSLPMRRWVGDR